MISPSLLRPATLCPNASRGAIRAVVLLALLSGFFAAPGGAATAGRETHAEEIILTPHDGSDREDREIQRWQQRIALTGVRADSLERLGWAYIAKARRTLDAGFYKLAEKTVDATEARFGSNDSTQLLRGHVLHNLHRFREAEAVARQLTSGQADAAAWALLADALIEQGKVDESVVALQRFVDLRPGMTAYSRIAHVRWMKGDLPGAITAMEDAVRAVSPREPEMGAWVQTKLAGYYLLAGNLTGAANSAAAALRRVPDYAPALFTEARILLARADPAGAVTALRRAVALHPATEYQWWLADALRASGDADGALAVDQQIKQAAVEDGRTLSLFLATRGDDAARAVQLAEREMADRPDAFSRDALAWSLALQGDLPAAATLVRDVMRAAPADARVFLHAGEILLRHGEPAEAARLFARAETLQAALAPSERALLARRGGASLVSAP